MFFFFSFELSVCKLWRQIGWLSECLDEWRIQFSIIDTPADLGDDVLRFPTVDPTVKENSCAAATPDSSVSEKQTKNRWFSRSLIYSLPAREKQKKNCTRTISYDRWTNTVNCCLAGLAHNWKTVNGSTRGQFEFKKQMTTNCFGTPVASLSYWT